MKLSSKLLTLFMALLMFIGINPLKANAYMNGQTGDFNFNNSQALNGINSKVYSVSGGSYVTGKIGKALQINNGHIPVSLSDLGITNNTQAVSVSFWYKWNGENNIMPVAFYSYDFYIASGFVGFNTGNAGDLYGINNPFKIGQYSHVTAIFNKGDYTLSSIYLNGVKQSLSQKINIQNKSHAIFTNDANLYISGNSNGVYELQGSAIDELKIFNRALTDAEAYQVYANSNPNISGQTTTVTGTFNATTIDVSIPSVNSFTFNPNTNEFNVQDIQINNNSSAPVYASIKGISVSPTSEWIPNLVSPTTYTDSGWNNLSQSDTASKVALGVSTISNSNWLNGIQNQNVWSTDLTNSVKVGAIKTGSSVNITPTLKVGRAITNEKTLTSNYVFEFGLQ